MSGVTDTLIARLQQRGEFGKAKYGKPLETWDGRNTVTDALEEALDLAVYLTKLAMERDDTAAGLESWAGLLRGGWNPEECAARMEALAAELRADGWRVGDAE